MIAREWQDLQPVRSYCEVRGIPVQLAKDELPNLWRLRETQKLVSWLRERPGSIVKAGELVSWTKKQPAGPWWSVLEEGIDDFLQEIGGGETDRKDVIEWLAEWSREARKRQSGLLLLSAHRAKGLEFDDVVILDGRWDRRSYGEDQDASRRLYYVAMTRARRSLTLLSSTKRHPFLGELRDLSVLVRAKSHDQIDVSDCKNIYATLNPSEVDLGFAGRLADGDQKLKAIEHASAGDPINLKRAGDRWLIVNANNVAIGRLARKFTPPLESTFVRGGVFAIISRHRSDSAEEYQSQIKRDQWSVVLPELVFEGGAK